MSLSRNWCFTLNNYSAEHVAFLTQTANVQFIFFGYEEAPKTGTPHLQGFVRFVNKKRLQTIKNDWNMPGIHLEPMRGDKAQNEKYCSKSKTYFTRGDWIPEQGARTDLDSVRNMALESGMRAVSSACNAQQIRVAEKFLTYNENFRDFKSAVIWIWGAPGVGKSRRARELTGEDDVYTKNDGHKWWDGYDGHDNVIIDDFRGSWWTLTEMLSLLDRYEKRLEVKGGMRQLLARKIVITSIHPPERVYQGISEEPIQQLLRRITEIIHLVPHVPEVGGNTGPPPEPENDNQNNIPWNKQEM